MPLLESRSGSSKAPIYDENNLPYNYLIIIDAGSKGTRAYVYAYKSTKYTLENNLPLDSQNGNLLPQLIYSKDWHKRIKPSIESSILKYGLHESYINNYLDHLLSKIYNIIPIEQHSRTPIFFHATAGLRALDPNLQSKLLEKICGYLEKNTDFYFPDCSSHVDILDGDVEGLYSWITLNYLMNNNASISKDERTYSLLQLGGGSAQICFQPKESELTESRNSVQLLNLELDQTYKLYSTSFLGFGLNQIHAEYLLSLINNSDPSNSLELSDPCLPLHYSKKLSYNNKKYTISGSGNFVECKENIYRQIVNNIEQCNVLLDSSQEEENEATDNNNFRVSKCMLTPLMPSFNFESDNVIAISGYWDTITQLLKFTGGYDSADVSGGLRYNSKNFIDSTIEICNSDLDSLQSKSTFQNSNDLSIEEMSNICFKATYVSSLLHSGYGLSLDATGDSNLRLNDKINNFAFSWTLGRALLYATDESIREYNFFYKNPSKRIGFYKNLAPNLFHDGSEQFRVPPRPDFQLKHEYPTLTFDSLAGSTATPTKSLQTPTENIVDFNNDNFFDEENYNYLYNKEDDDSEIISQPVSHNNLFASMLIIVALSAVILYISLGKKSIRYFLRCIWPKLPQDSLSNQSQGFFLSSSPTMAPEAVLEQLNGNLRKFHIVTNSAKQHNLHNSNSFELDDIQHYHNQNQNQNRPWNVDNNLDNDVISDLTTSDEDWDNDSDGIERAM